jgi:hypothetical protein
MASSWKIVLPTGVTLWESSLENAPSLQFVRENVVDVFFGPKSALSAVEKDDLLKHLTGEIMRNCPPKFTGIMLSNLVCCFWLDGGVRQLYALKSLNANAVCGTVFKVGEVVWTCRQCAKDATCVQCNACFKASNHEGHEVYFHRGKPVCLSASVPPCACCMFYPPLPSANLYFSVFSL